MRFLSAIFLFLFYIASTFAQEIPLSFQQLGKNEGLSQEHILCLYQDQEGFIWVGTYNGLNRYDGYNFNHYAHEDANSQTLSNGTIHAVIEDAKGIVWVATEDGLNKYNKNSNTFSREKSTNGLHIRALIEHEGRLLLATYGKGLYQFDASTNTTKPLSIKSKTDCQFINTIFKDKQNRIWLGYESCGLEIVQIKGTEIKTDSNNHNALSIQKETINSIIEDNTGNYWVGTWHSGLYKLNSSTQIISHLSKNTPGKQLADNTIRDLVLLGNNQIVAGSRGGLIFLNTETGKSKTYRHESGNKKSVSSNYFWSLLTDKNGSLWAGTFGRGISVYNPSRNKFHTLKTGDNCCPKKSNSNIILSDSKNRLWMASKDGGYAVYQSSPECLFNKVLSEGLPEKILTSAFEDKLGNIWLGSESGMVRISPNLNEVYHLPHNYFTRGNGFAVYNIIEDPTGNIWFCGWQCGFVKIPAAKKALKIKPEDLEIYNTNNFPALQSNTIWCIAADQEGKLWIGGENQHFCFNTKTKELKQVFPQIKNKIIDMYKKGDQLWMALTAGGAYKYDLRSKSLEFFPVKKNNKEFSLYTISEYKDNLFFSSECGLYTFNTKTNKFTSFDASDGMEGENFIAHSDFVAKGSKMLMSTTEGILVFSPASIQHSKENLSLYLAEIHLQGNVIDNTRITEQKGLKTIELSYDENVLSFKVAAINPLKKEKVGYYYRLKNFDDNWYITPAENRNITYTNLSPGEYILEVKASSDGDHRQISKALIHLIVLPPWYNTIWFRILAVIAIIAGCVGILYLRTRSIQKTNLLLSEQVRERTKELQDANQELLSRNEQVTKKTEIILDQQSELLDKKYTLEKNNEKLAEWNEFQQKLIGIIGHDIRGPLQRFSTLVKLMKSYPAEDIVEKMDESAATLSLLASDLVTWVSMQSAKGEIEKESFYWLEIIEKGLKDLDAAITDKNISFKIKNQNSDPVEGVVQIALASLRNILSNAIKYSAQGGVIEIETGIKQNHLSAIRVTDFGEGFDAEEVNKLISGSAFTGMRSYALQEGAGLGMTICNDMLKRTGGYIEARSIPGSGATFYMYFPTSEIHIIKEATEELPIEPPIIQEEKISILKGKKILLVDDDDEIRWALVKYLGSYVEIQELRSAEEALEWLQSHTPDMAILDINMPGMSGIDLCKKIKHSRQTAHVPCMVISGSSVENIRMEVLNAGADHFLQKPFSLEEILLQISSYFDKQEKLLKRFFSENLPIEQVTANSFNKEFLEKLINIIETNLSSPELNVDFLATEIGMSKSTMYRNLKSITGQSANGFVKNIRMRKSILLLKEGNMNIAEVAQETGFNSPSYFTTSFKKHFGYNPTDLK